MDIVLEVVGWLGSALLVFSVLQSRFMRFRVLNGIASIVLTGYNAVIGVWPMVAVNACLVLIDAWFIWRLARAKRDDVAFTHSMADPALRDWFVRAHGADLEHFHPGAAELLPDCRAAVIFHQDRAVGLVAWRPADRPEAELVADYVVPEYRDYAPGAYVYSAAGPLRAAGLRAVAVEDPQPVVVAYLRKLGFTESKPGRWGLRLGPP
ncbi:MAG: hypothetical protein LBK42_10595 [Propionibacteriaceae bacterium]|jgi:hypothetical protein|nr:hypothetical protein [Propionibacteriaceae bacterium]